MSDERIAPNEHPSQQLSGAGVVGRRYAPDSTLRTAFGNANGVGQKSEAPSDAWSL